eukprot:TRINITY_DN24460_c0_g1_i1.p1 TRINITY_DN24460_c0_g1~~TRINITY_DN24460_c0_g1_i1.p1  ORF type:complete len:160 (-),score=24.84 TRINITY_DN24460_c0_g1_i1:370-849(-)
MGLRGLLLRACPAQPLRSACRSPIAPAPKQHQCAGILTHVRTHVAVVEPSGFGGARLRWRRFRHRFPALGTGVLVVANVSVWALYWAAPEKRLPRPTAIFSRWLDVAFGKQRELSATDKLRAMLPTKAFWERHFFASYRGAMRGSRCSFLAASLSASLD